MIKSGKLLQAATIAVLLMAPVAAQATDVMDGAVIVKDVKVYIDPANFDSTRFLPPPPQGIYDEQDLETSLRWQKLRTPEMEKMALDDSKQSVFRWSTVLGPSWSADNFPIAKKFFHQVYKTESNLNKQGKKKWNRARPGFVSKEIKAVSEFKNYGSYPSGHSAFSHFTAIVLADMIPEKREEIMRRGWEKSFNRVVGGVHYLSDVEAGRTLGAICAVLVQNNPAFRADFEEARREVRAGLGLPL